MLMLLNEVEQEAQKPAKDDFTSQPDEPASVNISTELLELFERSLTAGKKNQAKATENDQNELANVIIR